MLHGSNSNHYGAKRTSMVNFITNRTFVIEEKCKPWLKFFVACRMSARVKFFQEAFTGQSDLIFMLSLWFLLLLLDTKGGKEGNRFMVRSFQSLKNLCQREGAREFVEWISEAGHLFFGEPDSFSKSVMHASMTPLGEDWSSFSFSISKHLKSITKTRNKDYPLWTCYIRE